MLSWGCYGFLYENGCFFPMSSCANRGVGIDLTTDTESYNEEGPM